MNLAPEFPVLYLIVDDAGVPVAGDDSLQSFLRATADADSPEAALSSRASSATCRVSTPSWMTR